MARFLPFALVATLREVEVEMKPEPGESDREAILAALAPGDDQPPLAIESAWQRAGLREATEESHP